MLMQHLGHLGNSLEADTLLDSLQRTATKEAPISERVQLFTGPEAYTITGVPGSHLLVYSVGQTAALELWLNLAAVGKALGGESQVWVSTACLFVLPCFCWQDHCLSISCLLLHKSA